MNLNLKFNKLSLAGLLLASTASAEAQEKKPETIEVRGHTLSHLDRFTKAQLVIDRKEIESANAPSLLDYMESIPGISVKRSAGLGSQASLYMRGSRNGDVLILIDGIPVADPTLISGGFQLDHMGVEQVERIEVSKGPMGLAYGSDGLAGVINIITAKNKAGGRLLGEVGSEDFARLAVNYQHLVSDELSISVGADGLQHGGQSDAKMENGNTEKDPYKRQGARSSFFWTKGPWQALILAESSSSRKDLDDLDFSDNVFKDDTNYTVDTDWESIRGQVQFSKDGFQSTFNGGKGSTVREYKNEADLIFSGTQNSKYEGGQSFVQWDARMDLRGVDFIVGLQSRQEEAESKTNFSGFQGSFDQSRKSQGVFTVADYQNENGFGLKVGARQDKYETFSQQTTYSLESSYNWGAHELWLRSGTGYKAPSLYQTYGLVVNEDLKPEESQGLEFGYNVAAGDVSFKALAYQRVLSDEIVYIDFTSGYQNTDGEGTFEGGELEIGYELASGHELSLWQSSIKYKNDQNTTLLLRPKLSRMFRYRGRISDHSIHLQALWTGERSSTTESLSPYTNLSGSYQWQQCEKLRWFIRGENLLNQEIQQTEGYSLLTRKYYGGLRWTF